MASRRARLARPSRSMPAGVTSVVATQKPACVPDPSILPSPQRHFHVAELTQAQVHRLLRAYEIGPVISFLRPRNARDANGLMAGPIDQRAAEFLLLGLTRTWISAATLGGPGGPRLAQVLLLAVALERVVEVPRRCAARRWYGDQVRKKNPGSKFRSLEERARGPTRSRQVSGVSAAQKP